jgi:hypothetical protein
MVRLAQLSESLTSAGAGIGGRYGLRQQADDLFVASETGEVFERQVDRPNHCAGGTEFAKLDGLSLTAGHAMTIHPAPDATLHSH